MESEGAAVSIKQAVTNALQAVLDGLPALLAAAAIVFAGWLLARLARRAARHLAGGANRLLERTLRRGTAATARLSPAFISLTGELAFWLVLVFAVIVAASVAGLGGLGESLNNIVRHLPNMIVGAMDSFGNMVGAASTSNGIASLRVSDDEAAGSVRISTLCPGPIR
jgi:hypothetical protein